MKERMQETADSVVTEYTVKGMQGAIVDCCMANDPKRKTTHIRAKEIAAEANTWIIWTAADEDMGERHLLEVIDGVIYHMGEKL